MFLRNYTPPVAGGALTGAQQLIPPVADKLVSTIVVNAALAGNIQLAANYDANGDALLSESADWYDTRCFRAASVHLATNGAAAAVNFNRLRLDLYLSGVGTATASRFSGAGEPEVPTPLLYAGTGAGSDAPYDESVRFQAPWEVSGALFDTGTPSLSPLIGWRLYAMPTNVALDMTLPAFTAQIWLYP